MNSPDHFSSGAAISLPLLTSRYGGAGAARRSIMPDVVYWHELGMNVALDHDDGNGILPRFEINTRVENDHMRIVMRNINVRTFDCSGKENSVQLLNCCISLFAQISRTFTSLNY